MPLDLARDARRLKVGLVVSAALCVAALGLAWARASGPEPVIQVTACTGDVDRCMSCHAFTAEKPHLPPLGSHSPLRMGCASCHGGQGRALVAQAAHASDAKLRSPHVEASCARCHVPGDGAGMEHLVRGARLYLELGCGVCHPLQAGGKGSWDFGPDLRALGGRSPAWLERAVLDPTENFADSTMPSFRGSLGSDREALTDLVVYLESLSLPRATDGCSLRPRSAALAAMPCAGCHAGEKGVAGGRLAHRCVYIVERKAELACAGCHKGEVPAGTGECPTVAERRAACAACHEEGGR